MCTALTLTAKSGSTFFGRNMDFSFELDPEVFVVPKGYLWHSSIGKQSVEAKNKFIGTGQNFGEVIFADGVNEKGLGVAALYFQGFAEYDSVISPEKTTIGSTEVVAYLLGECSSITDVIQVFHQLTIVGLEDAITKTVAPLHWFVVDKTGRAITIEKTMNGLCIFENEVGVLANSPTFDWHMENLRNYMNVSPYQHSNAQFGNVLLTPFGQGAGTIGLKGDYTSPSRFAKTVFQKSFVECNSNLETLINCFHVLNGVSIPKGVVMTSRNTPDYTQYTTFMDLNQGEYYFKTHDNPQIYKVSMKDYQGTKLESIGKLKRLVTFSKVN